jgi:predicted ATPase
MEDHEGQFITLIGEAGVGKSRLLDEFSRWLEQSSESLYLLKGRADPQMSRMPYALVRDMLAARFGILESDRAATARDKLEQGLISTLGLGQVEKVHFIGQLIGFDFSESPYLAGDARQLRDRAFQAMVRFLEQIVRKQPIVILLEDLHWADEGSLDLIDHLARVCHHLPLLMVGLARPSFLERRPLWGKGEEFHTLLTLRPLSKRDSRRLVEEILRQAPEIPAELRELIVTNAEGNPFYVEELIKSLIEDGVIVTGPEHWQVEPERLAGVRVPPTLVGVLQARLDRLALPEREVLQESAIVGRVFWDGAVAALHRETLPEPGPEPVEGKADTLANSLSQTLARLRGKEMIFARESSAFAGSQEYTFKHAILHEVTYETVLKRTRPRYHAQVAGWLVEQSGERAEEYAGLIGEHYERAEAIVEAVHWYELAGRQAQKTYANETALLWYNRILELLAQLNPDALLPFQQMQLSIHQALGEVLTLVGRYDEALEHYSRAQAMAEREAVSAERTVRQAGFCRRIAGVYELQGNYETAFQWVTRGLNPLSQSEASLEAAHLYRVGASIYYRQAKYDEVIEWCQKSLATASSFETREAKHVLAETYYYLDAIYMRRSDFTQAIQFCQAGIQLCQQIDNMAGQAQGYQNLAVIHHLQGNWQKGIEAFRRSLSIQEEIGDLRGQCHTTLNLGSVHTDRGEWDQALQFMEQSYTLARQINLRLEEGVLLSNLAQLYLYQQSWAEAEDYLRRSQALFSELDSLEFAPELERRWGEFYLKTGNLQQALTHTRHSIELAIEQSNPLEEGLSRRMLGQIYLAQGKHEAAAATLRHSSQILSPLNRYEAAKTQLVLARLSLAGDTPAEAQQALVVALETFEALGAQADLTEAQTLERLFSGLLS